VPAVARPPGTSRSQPSVIATGQMTRPMLFMRASLQKLIAEVQKLLARKNVSAASTDRAGRTIVLAGKHYIPIVFFM
jgi:CHASE3 domain sensor protein